MSDLILINGINTYTAESRFYFNYRNICDFYVKVLDLVENENSTQIKYYIYKTRPSSIGFIVILSISKINNGSKISIELQLFNKKILSSLFLNIIYNELKLMFNYLIESIRKNKQQFLLFNSNIIKSDFDFLSQIIQNKKIIKYLINGQFNKITIDEHDSHVIFNENDNNSFITTNDIYKIILKKKNNNNNILYDYINDNNIIFKIKSIKINEDYLSIQYEVLANNGNNKNDNNNCTNNLFTIIIRKLTDDYSFILIKYIWDKSLDKNIIFDIKKFINKILAKIEKVCKITRQ